MNATIDAFQQPANYPEIPDCCPAAREESVLLDANYPTIRNFPLVRQLIAEAFSKSDRVRLILTSNGNEDTGIATEWYLRRVVS